MQWIKSLFGWTGLSRSIVETTDMDPQSPSSLPSNPYINTEPLPLHIDAKSVSKSPSDYSPRVETKQSSESLLAEASDQIIDMIKKSTPSSPPKKKVFKKEESKKTKSKSTKKTKAKKARKVVKVKRSKTKSTKRKTKVPQKKLSSKKKAAKKQRKRKRAEMEKDVPTIPVSQSMTVSPRKKRVKRSQEKVVEKCYGERVLPGTSQIEYLVKYRGVRKSQSSWQKSDDSLVFQAVLAQYRRDMKNPSRKSYMKRVVRQIEAKQQK